MKSLRFGLVTALGHFWASGFVRPSPVAVRQLPMRINLRRRSGHRGGRARLSVETAGSPAAHRLTGCSYVLGPAVSERDTPYPRGRSTLPKIMRPFSIGHHLKLTRIGSAGPLPNETSFNPTETARREI
jgi:hypothetical protein